MNEKLVRLTESDIHSEESYNRAWENLWSQFDKNRKSINWDVYERYKGNPQAIKHWFDKWGVDVNEYLNEARNINKKQIVRLTEGDLHRIVKESVNRILKEVDERKVVRITVPTMNINNKLIEYDDLIAFCNEHNLGVWDWNKMTFIPIEEFEYKPSWHSVGSYGLSTNHGFQTAPEITLVPQGTKAPNNSWQKRFILPDGY